MGPIAINARAAVRPELGGVERWARELVARLPALRPEAYEVLRPPAALAHRAGHAWEQGVLPLRARGCAVLLSPANLAPVAFGRNVVVIHDAAALRHPGWYSRSYAAWQARILPAIARRALHVVTVSEFSRREIAELTGTDPGRMTVVPGGVGEAFRPDADAAAAAAALGLGAPYVLCVASQTARKGLRLLGPLADALRADGIELVVAGGRRPQFAPGPGVRGPRLLGHVPDAQLPGLYAGARAFVLPSLYEGFGLPVLEAMACGTPVVATRAGALPETAGDAARLTDPDAHALRAAVLEVLADPAALRAAGLERAARYGWAATAAAVDAVLVSVAAGRRRA